MHEAGGVPSSLRVSSTAAETRMLELKRRPGVCIRLHYVVGGKRCGTRYVSGATHKASEEDVTMLSRRRTAIRRRVMGYRKKGSRASFLDCLCLCRSIWMLLVAARKYASFYVLVPDSSRRLAPKYVPLKCYFLICWQME